MVFIEWAIKREEPFKQSKNEKKNKEKLQRNLKEIVSAKHYHPLFPSGALKLNIAMATKNIPNKF